MFSSISHSSLAMVDIVVAIIAAMPPTLASLLSARYGKRNHDKLMKVSVQLDGRLSEYIQLVSKSSHAEGVKQEMDSRR
jgi:hypothetical protein